MLSGKLLSAGYSQAGTDFLADRLEGMFRIIVSEEDKALHNVIQREVWLMVGDSKAEANKFYRTLAGSILEKKLERKAKKNFLGKVAEAIMSVAKK